VGDGDGGAEAEGLADGAVLADDVGRHHRLAVTRGDGVEAAEHHGHDDGDGRERHRQGPVVDEAGEGLGGPVQPRHVGQALGLGATVAVTHTAGVLALGIALSTTASFAPEALYPWLGLASGLLVAVIGAMLLVRAVRHRDTPFLGHQHGHGPGQHTHHWDLPVPPHGPADAVALQPSDVLVAAGAHHAGGIGLADVDVLPAPVHHHDHDHSHHHDHSHDHDHDHDHGDRRSPRMGRGGVMLMGLAGGLVPSPSALVVLLGAIALGRAWFGVVVIAAYGVGMAATLVAAGLLMAKLRDRVTAFVAGAHPTLGRSMRYLPMGTASLVLLGGFVLAGRALGTL
jgi:nickel/cobalt transporter (NicO) family protein